MPTKQIKFFRKLSVKLVIILLIIVPIDLFYSHWLLGHYGEGLSLFWHLYIGGINGIAIGGFFALILSYFYDAYLDKREFIDYCREVERKIDGSLALTWACHICGKERPDEKISVHTTRVNDEGTIIEQNVRYCNDNQECIEKAKSFSFFEKQKPGN